MNDRTTFRTALERSAARCAVLDTIEQRRIEAERKAQAAYEAGDETSNATWCAYEAALRECYDLTRNAWEANR